MMGLTAQGPNRRQRLAALLHRTRMMPALTLARSMWMRDLRILAYHRVLSVNDERDFDFDLDLVSASGQQFREQMALLKQRFHPVCFRELIDACDRGTRLPPRPVIVTFDDGYDDNYRIAFPILRELGVPATFFVSTGHVDSGRVFAYDWLVHMICRTRASRLHIPQLALDQALPDGRPQRRALASELLDRMKWLDADVQASIVDELERQWSMPRDGGHADCRPMSWDQLREMQAAGMEIGSHGIWHNMLAKLPPQDMVAEIAGSRDALKRELGAPPVVLSYPVGGSNAYNEGVIRAAQEAGYRMGCSYVSGTNPLPMPSPFELRRLPVERHMDLAWFDALVGLPEAFIYPSRQRIG